MPNELMMYLKVTVLAKNELYLTQTTLLEGFVNLFGIGTKHLNNPFSLLFYDHNLTGLSKVDKKMQIMMYNFWGLINTLAFICHHAASCIFMFVYKLAQQLPWAQAVQVRFFLNFEDLFIVAIFIWLK